MAEDYEEMLRAAEVGLVRRWLRPGQRLLEIGGGYGFQARLLAASGCDVTSIDVPQRVRRTQVFPVQDYDGRTIPAADATFDVVFSSNVLEHVRELGPMLAEMRRVLKPGGLSVHVLPSASWRFWHSVIHPVFVVRFILAQRPWAARAEGEGANTTRSIASVVAAHGLHATLKRALLGPILAHGEYPNSVAELWYFTRRRWRRVFEQAGYRIIHESGNRLLYSGHGVNPGLSLKTRRRLARVLGSSCHLFVLGLAGSAG